jgi:glycosyltransferase involved in cell wall biosynthesis
VATLAAAFPEDEWRVLVPGRGPAPLADSVARAGAEARRHAAPSRILHGVGTLTGRPRLDRLLGVDVDVVWAPAPAPLALGPRTPFVLTVHDLAWEERPGDFTRYERAWHRLASPQRLARRAARVIAVSRATAAAATASWALDPERVVTIRSGPGRPPAGGAVAALPPLPDRYLLFVGALEPRKGIDVLAAAFADARARGLDAELVVVGEGRLAGALGGPGVRVLGRVGDAELDALEAGALALVLPSHIEGFGFTPLEALSRGTPALVSDLPALRETLGDGARYVAPGDAPALADALLELAGDDALRASLARAGAARVAELSWERAAHETRAALAAAAGA